MKVLIFLAVLLPACLALPMEHSVRIVGGADAKIGQFPHQVSMRRSNSHFCGGSIITPTVILTAAHCVYGSTSQGMTVVAGTNSLDEGGVSVVVAQALYHGSYDPQTTLNDIALLKLAAPLPIGGDIQLIQLNGSPVKSGETLTLSGWGLTSFPGDVSRWLQYIKLGAIDLQTCANQLVGANPIAAGHVCTSSPAGQGGCKGDSGGPLINADKLQVGIVSWGVPCAKGRPDVYTSVAFYAQWIVDAIKTVESM